MPTKQANSSHWKWTTSDEDAGMRLDVAVLRAMQEGRGDWSTGVTPALSRNQVQRWLQDAGYKLGEKVVADREIFLTVAAPEPLALTPEHRELEILFEDEHLLIVNKPPSLTVHPSETQRTGTLVHALLGSVKDLSGIGGKLRPGIVHRIDKDTSGALVVTKTDIAHQRLVETFSQHAIERIYWALCYGVPPARHQDWKRIETLIARHPRDRKRMSTQVKSGRKAVTLYRPIELFGDAASWIEAKLETGRTHQVRVHLTAEHLSLLGDPVYGTPGESQTKWRKLPTRVREAIAALPGQALHARVLGFKHPVSGKPVRVEAPAPPAFAAVLSSLQETLGKQK